MGVERSFFFIVNPFAGKAGVKSRFEALRKLLSKKSVKTGFVFSDHPGHATDLAKNHLFIPGEIAVSIGGDGTHNEIASALLNTHTPVAILPAGSGNGLARSLKIHRIPVIDYLLNSIPDTIDCGKIGDRYFFCTCGIGFDAWVAADFNKGKQRGLLNYIRKVVRLYLRYKPVNAELKVDGKPISGRFFLITVANAPQYGNDALIAPSANLKDGKFEVVIVRPFSFLFMPVMVLALFGGFVHKLPWVTVLQATEVEFLKVSSPYFHYDGESTTVNFPLCVSLMPRIASVMVPS